MSVKDVPIVDLDQQLQKQSPQQIIAFAAENYQRVAISFSGAEDVVLVDMAAKLGVDIEIFSLDTGRLHAETYRFIEAVRTQYGVQIDVLSPEGSAVSELVKEKGLYSFYEDGHKECCSIRKIGPLRNKLLTLDAWITGQRKDQSPDTRSQVPAIQDDRVFSRKGETLTKFNPLANWTSADVWHYIRGNNVPYNKLHDQGFISIGCEPCTRPVGPGQHEREGRWWWELATQKECGLHSAPSK